MLGKLVDVEPVRGSACGSGSDDSGSRLVMPEERGATGEIGKLGITCIGDCSRVSAMRSVLGT